MENLAWALSVGLGIDQLRVEERPRREPGHGEARVRIEWISLNRRDLLLVEGTSTTTAPEAADHAVHRRARRDRGDGRQLRQRSRSASSVVIHFFPGWIAGALPT